MKQFTDSELKILQTHKQITHIGKKIASSRSRTGHISRLYVHKVLTGQIDNDSAVSREIISRAKTFLETYKKWQ